MKPLKRYPPQIEETVERRVYACAIQSALQRIQPLKDHRPPVYIFRLPKGADEGEYRLGACLVMLGLEEGEKLNVLAPHRNRKGKLEFDDIVADVAEGKAAIILIGEGVSVPATLVAAADGVFDLDPVRGEHLQVAAQVVLSLTLNPDQADELLQLPRDLLFAAMRRGRTFEQIVAKIQETPRPTQPTPPTLDELGGFGEAGRWGLQLAQDIKSWRSELIVWDDVDSGLLLSGPPGTGKTLFGSALARSCGMAFVSASVAQWQSHGHLGDLLGAMRASFKQAADASPSVLFLDEFDSIGDRSRFSHDNANYSTQVVNGLLEAIDGSERREGVVVVGATNLPEAIDPAFLRPGRLGRHIRIGLPDFDDRKVIARTYFGKDLSDVDAVAIAGATSGMTGADFSGIAKDVRRKARTTGSPIDAEIILSCLPPALPLVGRERRVVCAHEAGHAVVGLTIGYGVLKTVVVAREIREKIGASGGAVFETRTSLVRSEQDYLDEICVRLGGIAAERVLLHTTTDGAGGSDGSDLAAASDTATLMVVQFGMGDAFRYCRVSTAVERDQLRRSLPEVAAEVGWILAQQHERACRIVAEHLGAVDALAQGLDAKGVLGGSEVKELLGNLFNNRPGG